MLIVYMYENVIVRVHVVVEIKHLNLAVTAPRPLGILVKPLKYQCIPRLMKVTTVLVTRMTSVMNSQLVMT